MFPWFGERRPPPDVAMDADALQAALGAEAYDIARELAGDARVAHKHWDAVRREIGRRTGRELRDLATRMLERW